MEPHFPTEQQLAESEARARREADELSNQVTMQSGGVTMLNPEGEVIRIDCVGDLSSNPWVASCTPIRPEAEGGRRVESSV